MPRRITGRGFEIVGDEFAKIFGVSVERCVGDNSDAIVRWYSNTYGRSCSPTDIKSLMVFPIPGGTVKDERGQVHLCAYDAATLFAQGKLTLNHFENAAWAGGSIYVPNVQIDGENVVARIFRNVYESVHALAADVYSIP
jgi:hypothetical protein